MMTAMTIKGGTKPLRHCVSKMTLHSRSPKYRHNRHLRHGTKLQSLMRIYPSIDDLKKMALAFS